IPLEPGAVRLLGIRAPPHRFASRTTGVLQFLVKDRLFLGQGGLIMPHTIQGSRTEVFDAALRRFGQDFTFRLCTRPLRLGAGVTVQYSWMDSSDLRSLRSDAAAANFRNCIGHWAGAMRSRGLGGELDQQIHYVLAVCYGLVTTSKGLQEVYRDAYLAPDATTAEGSLPQEVRQRIKDTIRSQDRFQVQRELDDVLGRFEVPSRLLPLLQEALRRWVGTGVVRMREDGNDGLVSFLKDVDSWLQRLRKRSDRWVRHCLNLFDFECKVSFHTCYANAWVDLIPWLREQRGLDVISERFLRFWPIQNQPIEVPHGRTAGGVYYPTHVRASVVQVDRHGHPTRRSLTVQTKQLGPTHVRDVFSGQVLSLHPLSGFFMKDPALCAIAGKFFASDACAAAMQRRQVEGCEEYWNLVGAILTAAHLYRQALDAQFSRRGTHQQVVGDVATLSGTRGRPEQATEGELLEDFARASGHACPACRQELRLRHYEPASAEADRFRADFECRACRLDVSLAIRQDELTRWLLGPCT